MTGEKVSFQAIIEITPEIIKDAKEDEEFIGYFEGVASTPQIDLEGDAFTVDVLKENAEKLKDKPILFGHGRDPKLKDTPVGKILDAWMDGGNLKIKAGIYKKFKDIWEKIKNGILRGLSIGGIAKKIKRETVNVIEDAEIEEVSLAPKPVNPSAQIYNIFGKCFKVEDGILTIVENENTANIDVKLEKGGESEKERFEKVDLDLPIVKRASWDGDAAAQRIFKWAEKEDGTIDKSKAGKLFLIVRGDGKQRGDYAWPVGDIVDGKPVLVSSGIITAIKYASGARGVAERVPEKELKRVRNLLEKLVAKMKKTEMLPEDYEVPWKRKEKTLIYEHLIMKALETEARFEVIDERLEILGDILGKNIDKTCKLSNIIGELRKAVEERERKVEKAQGERKPKAVTVGEEIVRKAEPKTYTSYPDSSFLGLHRTLREIK